MVGRHADWMQMGRRGRRCQRGVVVRDAGWINVLPELEVNESDDDSSLYSSVSSGGVVFEASTPVQSRRGSAQPDAGAVAAPGRSPAPPQSPTLSASGSENLSVEKLLDLQENEFIAICSIFEDGVEELPVSEHGREAIAELATCPADGRPAEEEGSPGAEAKAPEAMDAKLPSQLVRRYRVKLFARSGCSTGGDVALEDRGPSAELEVAYGKLYPMESPLLLLSNIDGLHKEARQELRSLVRGEIEKLTGRECVFDVCLAIREHLRQHYDPSVDLPLHERFQRREAEEAEKRKMAEREGKERAERIKAEERERQMLELERVREKHRAAKRLGQAFHKGGELTFLPDEHADESTQAKAGGKAPKAASAKEKPGQRASAGCRLGLAASSGTGGRYATDFEELRFLGRGGFGVVTMVRHRVDKCVYAIKRIELTGTPSSRESLLQECATLPRLSHLHIVRYYQAWIERESVEAQQAPLAQAVARHDTAPPRLRQIRRVASTEPVDACEGDALLSQPQQSSKGYWAPQSHPTTTTLREFLYIQMEFCDGTTLREAIDSGQLQKDVALIWKLFRQILDALAYIHSKGLLHRDLKPPNIFLSRAEGGHVKIGDFGLTTTARPRTAAGEASAGWLVGDRETHVGTVYYMAPELNQPQGGNGKKGRAGRRPARRLQDTNAFDQKVDMFSLGVIFFEMWHPPFYTAMERQHILGQIANGLGPSPAQLPSHAVSLLPGDVKAPAEVGRILDSLLARDPDERMTAAELLDSNSGLLPPGAYDPQVQRILEALKRPGSTESVALIEALFARSEDVGKDTPYFERIFSAPSDHTDAEAQAEARDALQQLLRETCRRHSTIYELCPLMRPARTGVDDAGRQGGPQLLDKDNTRVELRTNLTEPFARAGAAKLVQTEPLQDGEGSWPSQARRRYHMGTVYMNAKGAQFGHPMEISSSVVQFMWHPSSSSSSPPPSARDGLGASPDFAHEAELLHLLGEFLSAAGLAGPAGRVELQLADTLLLPLLLDCTGLRGLREAQRAEQSAPAAGSAQASRLARLTESLGKRAEHRSVAGSRDRAVAELASALLAIGCAEGRSVNEGALRTWPLSMSGIAELREAFATEPSAGAAAATQACSPSVRLWEVLERFRGLSRMVDGLVDVTVDVLWQGRDVSYGPGLVFRLLLHDAAGSRVLIGEGGRLDRVLGEFADLHVPQPSSPASVKDGGALASLRPAPKGVSVELAVDKLAAALVLLAPQGVCAMTSSASGGSCGWRRGRATSSGPSGGGAAAHTPGAWERGAGLGPWWRQLPGCWPHVLVGAATEESADRAAALTEEALRIAAGLWRLGARCEVKPAEVGPLDLRMISIAHRQAFVGDACGPALPDFAVVLRHSACAGYAPGGSFALPDREPSATDAWVLEVPPCRRDAKNRASPRLGPSHSPPPLMSAMGGVTAFELVSSDDAASPRGRVVYQVRAMSDAAVDTMERALKDFGPKEFEDRQRLFEFFDKLARRLSHRPLGQVLPWASLEALIEQ